LIDLTETVQIDCPVSRLWRALTDPAEVVLWDTGVRAALDAPSDYPRPGQHVRWSYRLGPLPLVLHDRPSEVLPNKTLRSSIQLGPFEIDETYTLESSGPMASGLSARMCLWSTLPVVGGWLERWMGRRLAQSTVSASLAAIKAHCEKTGAT
jgi:hypothetical protein